MTGSSLQSSNADAVAVYGDAVAWIVSVVDWPPFCR